jgi:hypothetical protein
MEFGTQSGKVVSMYPGVSDSNGNVFVNCKFQLPSGEFVYTKVYITEKSKTLARACLKKCGFDMDSREMDLVDLEQKPDLFAGTDVLLDIYEEPYNGKMQTRVNIVTERPKAEKGALAGAMALLRSAKKSDGEGKEKVIQGFPKQPRPKPENMPGPEETEDPAGGDIPF